MGGEEVARHEEDGEHVVVLAHEELERVHVDRVGVAARRDDLPVVVVYQLFAWDELPKRGQTGLLVVHLSRK